MNSAPNFDALARPYRWLEYLSFGPFLWRCRVHFLPRLSDCRSALILGDGDGRFTAALLKENPRLRAHAVDLSAPMMQTLERRAKPHCGRLTGEVADLRAWSPTSGTSYDLIVSHFFLDCLTTVEVAGLARRLAASSVPEAFWLISDFAVPTTLFGRIVAKPIVSALYFVFDRLTGLRLRSLPDHARSLEAAGWSLEVEHLHLRGLLTSQLWRRPAMPACEPSE